MSTSKFKIGDKVRYVRQGPQGAFSRDWAEEAGLILGGVYLVSECRGDLIIAIKGDRLGYGIHENHFDLAEPALTEAAQRKALPLATGCIDYFPDALLAVAELSRIGNEQHNPGQPLHWDRAKSTDEADALMRHFIDRGKLDTDGVRHSAKVAWRALALLQKEIEAVRILDGART